MGKTSLIKCIFPYILITLSFFGFLFLKHRDIFNYRFNPNLITEYLRSQDIEDPQGRIKDRIFLSDSHIYISSGYLYAKGNDPTLYNFQHPPLMKYLFGFSTLLTDNPFYVQIIFGLSLLFLSYFLGKKLFNNTLVSLAGSLLLLVDPVFSGMMNETLLDLGQSVFAISYIILTIFYPDSFVLQGIILGFFAASKFWSTALIFVLLIFGYKIIFKKEKINIKKVFLSFVITGLVFSLIYIVSFVKTGGTFNIFVFEAKVLKYMLSHNSAVAIGGSVSLFLTGYFSPWWQSGITRSNVWSILWPVSLFTTLFMALKTKIKDVKFFFYVLPIVYIILISTQVPFTRYFVIILPYVYLDLSSAFFVFIDKYKMNIRKVN